MDLLKNENYLAALEYIATHDLAALPAGRNEIKGNELYVNIVDTCLIDPAKAKYEAHLAYVDIHVPLSCPESYGVIPVGECKAPAGRFDEEKDFILYDDPVPQGAVFTAQPGQLVVFSPSDAHAPLIGEGRIHKAIFKVKVR